jgi:hypothetical protein
VFTQIKITQIKSKIPGKTEVGFGTKLLKLQALQKIQLV